VMVKSGVGQASNCRNETLGAGVGVEQTGDGKALLTFTVRETGVLVTGDPSAVTAYTARLESQADCWGQPVTVSEVADVGAAASALMSVAASAGSYVQLSQRSMELLRQHQMIPGQTAGFFQGAVRGAHGQFAGTLDFQTVSLAASQAAALQLAAATIALRVAVEDVQQAVAKVEGKVDELLARARANDVGPVVAHHAVLAEMTSTLDREGSLPSTDWDTVQHLGANVPGAIEALRRYVLAQIEVLDADAPAQDRARRLRRVVESGQTGLMLQLLVLAEDSYYHCQRLRLERVRVVEPDRLAGVVGRANQQLAADLRRDGEMVDLLHARLTAYATQRPLERLHPLAARDLQGNVTSLRQDLEEFAVARRLQVEGWSDFTKPTISDAVRELRDRTVATGQHAIKQASAVAEEVGGAATDVGRAVAGRAGGLGQEACSRATSLARDRLQRRRDQTDQTEDAE
jgi:hypothetical protein